MIIINQSTGTHPQLQSTKLHVGQSALAVASASACWKARGLMKKWFVPAKKVRLKRLKSVLRWSSNVKSKMRRCVEQICVIALVDFVCQSSRPLKKILYDPWKLGHSWLWILDCRKKTIAAVCVCKKKQKDHIFAPYLPLSTSKYGDYDKKLDSPGPFGGFSPLTQKKEGGAGNFPETTLWDLWGCLKGTSSKPRISEKWLEISCGFFETPENAKHRFQSFVLEHHIALWERKS